MDLTIAIYVYAESPKLKQDGFKSFIKTLGKVDWTNQRIFVRYGMGGPFPASYFDSFTVDDKNYMLKLAIKIGNDELFDYIIDNIVNDVTEETYDYIVKKYEPNNDNWNVLQTKFETIKNERYKDERYKDEKKAVKAEAEKLEKQLAEYMLRDRGNKVVKRLLEEVVNEHLKKKTA